jgi:hypothetical protein
MKKLFLFTLILFSTSCYQPIPDGKYRLINLNGIKKNSSNQYFSIKGQEFNSFSVENGLKKDNGTKIIQYERNNIFNLKQKDTVYRWKYLFNKDTLKLNSLNEDVNLILLKEP